MIGELLVALFALLFLAFCLTAIALYALSRNNDEVADESVIGLQDLSLGANTPRTESSDDTPDSDAGPE